MAKAFDAMLSRDPDRAKALKQQFLLSGSWPALLKAIRTYQKVFERAFKVRYAKKTKLSFIKHFTSPGDDPSVAEGMWKRCVDEYGKPLQKCKNHRGAKCLRVPLDDQEEVNERFQDLVTGKVGEKHLRRNEAKALLDCPDAMKLNKSNPKKRKEEADDSECSDDESSESEESGDGNGGSEESSESEESGDGNDDLDGDDQDDGGCELEVGDDAESTGKGHKRRGNPDAEEE